MQGYEFRYGPQLISGPGAARRLAELLPAGRCLFVTDATVRALGLADPVLAALPDTIVFDAVEEDPSRETLMAAVAAGAGCASVVGFGGGSPMDVAKLAAYLLGSGDALESIWGVGVAKGERLPLILVPTTEVQPSPAATAAIRVSRDGSSSTASNTIVSGSAASTGSARPSPRTFLSVTKRQRPGGNMSASRRAAPGPAISCGPYRNS